MSHKSCSKANTAFSTCDSPCNWQKRHFSSPQISHEIGVKICFVSGTHSSRGLIHQTASNSLHTIIESNLNLTILLNRLVSSCIPGTKPFQETAHFSFQVRSMAIKTTLSLFLLPQQQVLAGASKNERKHFYPMLVSIFLLSNYIFLRPLYIITRIYL